jgi:hypothetical protein
LNYAVAVALGILAYIFWKEKSEDLAKTQHDQRKSGNAINYRLRKWNK